MNPQQHQLLELYGQQQQHQHQQQHQQQQQQQQGMNIIQTSPQPIPRLSHPTPYHLQQTQLRQQQQQIQLRQQKAIAVNDGAPNIGAHNNGAHNNGSLPTPNNSFSTIDPTLITAGQQLHQPSYNGATNVIGTIKQESTDIPQTEMDFDHTQQSFLSPQSNSPPLGSPTNLDADDFGQPFNPQGHIEILEIPSPSPHDSYNSQTSMSLPVQFAGNNSEWFNPNFETGSPYPLIYSTTTPEMNYLSTIMDPDGDGSAQQKAAMLSEKKRRRRESHNAVERRRRDNINEQIQELSRLLPDVFMDSSNKPNKGLILRKSVDYIKHLKNTVDVQSNQMVKLESKFKQLETGDASSFSFVSKNISNINNSNNDNK